MSSRYVLSDFASSDEGFGPYLRQVKVELRLFFTEAEANESGEELFVVSHKNLSLCTRVLVVDIDALCAESVQHYPTPPSFWRISKCTPKVEWAHYRHPLPE